MIGKILSWAVGVVMGFFVGTLFGEIIFEKIIKGAIEKITTGGT